MSVMRYVSLIILSVQNVSLILVMRYARTRTGDMFLASSAVVLSELVKLSICMVILLVNEGWRSALEATKRDPIDSFKITVPAFIYVAQNNLLFLAVSHLDAAVYQVSYQLKILTTALFSVFILRKKITGMQWVSLFLLFIGVAVVQLEMASGSSSKTERDPSMPAQNPVIGMVAVVVACLMSGFAGVYFEKTLKGSRMSLMLRNVQLAMISVVLGVGGQCINERDIIASKGYLFGFDGVVWLVVGLHSVGGLTVAMVVKYADNILKGFACSASIVLSCIFSVYVFHVSLSGQFMIGAGLVVLSIVLYAAYAPTPTQPEITIKTKKEN